jgi:hypothetical protein
MSHPTFLFLLKVHLFILAAKDLALSGLSLSLSFSLSPVSNVELEKIETDLDIS